MNEKLQEAQDVFLDKINQICAKFGLNNIMAQLYAILYLSDKPLSLNDMVQELKISKGSASVNIRALERYGVVRKVWVKGSRRDYYEAEKDITKVVMDRVRSMAEHRLSEFEDIIKSSNRALSSISPSGNEEKEALKAFRSRLNELENLRNKAQSLFNLLNSRLLTNILIPKTRANKKGNAIKEEVGLIT